MPPDERLKILVIDDDVLDRMAVRRALRGSEPPITVEEADESAVAFDRLSRETFDCLILDYRLPGTDGLTVLREIRGRGIRTPVIITTGQGDERLAVELIKAGATDYLAKASLSPENLTLSIRNAIRVSRAEEQTAQTESALRESEARFRTMADSAPVLLWMGDESGARQFFNQSWLAFTGRTLEQETGRGWEHVFHPDDLAQCLVIYDAALQSRQPFELETRLRRVDGEFRWVLESGTPRLTPDGKFVGYIGSGVDITDRKQATERQRFLAEASQLLASSLDSSVVLTTLAHLVVPYLADWCTVDLVDLLESETQYNRLAVSVANPEHDALALELQRTYTSGKDDESVIASVIRTGQSVRHEMISSEFRAALDDGLQALGTQVGITSLMSVPLTARDQIFGVISFATGWFGRTYTAGDLALVEDLARRASVAIDNAQLYREAQEAVKTREVFLSVASHELKTPLTSLSGNAQLLERRVLRESSLNERDRRALRVIVEQSARLQKMIEALLDISRLQNGQLSIQRAPMDLSALTRRIVEEMQPALERHTVVLVDSVESLQIMGDELRLEQVLQNLIQNAIKYSPKGGAVEIKLYRTADHAGVAITDHGIGVPQSAIPQLFKRFYRAPNVSGGQISGIGVGLFVVKEIVTLHGGTIEIASVENEGSTFTIELPLAA